MTQVEPGPSPVAPPSTRELRPPTTARERLLVLGAHAERDRAELEKARGEREALDAILARGEPVKRELERLSNDLFQRVLDTVQEKLTQALREVFTDEIGLRAERHMDRRSGQTIRFSIVRQGQEEDVLKGQGGSVVNVLSVGLRMFALATQDPAVHRPFLVLDEQDCWLRPDLVPRLVRIVAAASETLGLQVLMISHHDPQLFAGVVDRLYELVPAGGHVTVKERPVGRPADERAAVGALADPTPEDMGHGLMPTAPLAEQVSSGAVRKIEVEELADFGLRLARLEARPSVVLLFASVPLSVEGADGQALALLEDGSVVVDQALLDRAVVVHAPELGVRIELEGGPDGALAYEVRLVEAAPLERLLVAGAAPGPSLEAAALVSARRLERELLELVSYAHPGDPNWIAWRERVVRARDELESAAVALERAGAPPRRLRRVLVRLDERGARLATRSSSPAAAPWWTSPPAGA